MLDYKQILSEAEALVENIPQSSTPKEINDTINRAIGLYEKILAVDFNFKLSVEERCEIIDSYLWYIPEQAYDMLTRYRDMLSHLRGQQLEKMLLIVKHISKLEFIDTYERLRLAVTLYNHGDFEFGAIFEKIAISPSTKFLHKIEACKFLFSTRNDNYVELAQETLIEMIAPPVPPEEAASSGGTGGSENRERLTSKERYDIICDYQSRYGIRTTLLRNRLQIPYDEVFVWGLQSAFFFCKDNGIRERLLSANALLKMKCCPLEDKNTIENELLSIARDATSSEQIRADAADILIRDGSNETTLLARRIVKELGFSAVNRTSNNLLQRVETFYTNSQNTHLIKEESVNEFVEKMVADTKIRERPFSEVRDEIGELIRFKIKDPEQKYAALEGLSRTANDVATFTLHSVTSAEVLNYVYARICNETNSDTKELLTNLLLEELASMAGWCSSGHITRFILVLQPVDNSIKISYDQQIEANIAGRIVALIRSSDEELQGPLSMAMLPNPDPADLEVWRTFYERYIPSLKEELENEFVQGNFVSSAEFEVVFNKILLEKWAFHEHGERNEHSET